MHAHAELLKGHKWLDTFQKPRRGDTKLQHILARYEQILHAKQENERWNDRLREQPTHHDRAYLRPSPFNRALPRLKPQAIHIGYDPPAAQSTDGTTMESVYALQHKQRVEPLKAKYNDPSNVPTGRSASPPPYTPELLTSRWRRQAPPADVVAKLSNVA
ncbi:hypothetical protein FIBSPDRAFT_1051354 [Athelia psychrophila]|uniref:Uncharacterized protein n=1 Tax=Athelia psychrophila TaxID=1759441 RepID=A0A165ZB96_9AGAM|nr:hypothetical protein FIBSPDRAFT_1051354 [Fibularhizoctonia sp. CBS 109695]